jgi:hypothetical protein
MTKLRALLLGALAALGCGIALAQQTITTPTLSGNEAWQVGQGISGSSFFLPSSQVRNTQGVPFTALASGALAVTAPPAPFDGEIFIYSNNSSGANTATMTFTANTGQTVNSGAVATLAQYTSAEWRYSVPNLTWYRIR